MAFPVPGAMQPPAPKEGSVASAFHGLMSSALAPKAGRKMAPGPMVKPPGAPLPLGARGTPAPSFGHAPAMIGQAPPNPGPSPRPPIM